MLVFALVAASSCSLIIKDEEVDKQTPIIEVAAGPLPRPRSTSRLKP